MTLISFLLFINLSCNKKDSIQAIDSAQTIATRGGIALTLDDNYIDNWYTHMDLFDSLGVRATFYISNYNKLSSTQKGKLQKLKDHGHEIAFHSTNHVNFLKFADSAKIDRLIKEEVMDGLRLMNDGGLFPKTFAYPYGQHNDILDKLLLKSFKSVRALNGTKDLSKSLASIGNNKLIFGLGIDETSKRDLSKIEGLLELAQSKNKCAVLLVHNIERKDITMQIPLWKLKQIINKAKSLSLKFYTISEISK
ncbi:MAG TPA: polysaccharide deacetylase family protein [Chitinophagaceae bacterium]|nr:polysaccharide deacetylase family protein [Chitinophagaceae bacterium]